MTPTLTAPPFCDLAWLRAGPARFTAARTPLYDAAVSCAGASMEAAGFDVRAPLATLDLSGCQDLPGLAKRMAVWTSAARKRRAFEEARDAALRPPSPQEFAHVQVGLDCLLSTAPWAYGGRRDLAERFVAAWSLTRRQYEYARDILSSAEAVLAAVDARLATPAGVEAMERATDEGVRADLLAACRELSALDGDRCREANSQGWSAVSSGPGHRLAGRGDLTVLEAAHALALVHPHRKQLSNDLRERLFGAAPDVDPRHA
jgi:hypothetical protein